MLDEFLSQLVAFLLGTPAPTDKPYPIWVFAPACAVLGTMVVILDLCYFGARRVSLFDFKYTWKTVPIIFIAWAVGAFLTGYFGHVFAVLQISLLAAAVAGMGWPTIVIQLIKE